LTFDRFGAWSIEHALALSLLAYNEHLMKNTVEGVEPALRAFEVMHSIGQRHVEKYSMVAGIAVHVLRTMELKPQLRYVYERAITSLNKHHYNKLVPYYFLEFGIKDVYADDALHHSLRAERDRIINAIKRYFYSKGSSLDSADLRLDFECPVGREMSYVFEIVKHESLYEIAMLCECPLVYEQVVSSWRTLIKLSATEKLNQFLDALISK